MRYVLLLLNWLAVWILSPASSVEKFAYVAIISPGENAQVHAPIPVQAVLIGESARSLRLELYGADGRLLARRLLGLSDVGIDPNQPVVQLDYEVPRPVEQGWLRLVVLDEYRRFMAVDTQQLDLRSGGGAELALVSEAIPDITIEAPKALAQVAGGVVRVEGRIAAEVNLPLRVRLIDRDGVIVGQRLAGSSPNADQGDIAFFAEVPYWVTQPTSVRLLVFEEGRDLPQVLAASSLELVLNP